MSALFYLTLEAERLDVNPVVLAAGMLVVAASTVVHGVTATPGRVFYRKASTRGEIDVQPALGPSPHG